MHVKETKMKDSHINIAKLTVYMGVYGWLYIMCLYVISLVVVIRFSFKMNEILEFFLKQEIDLFKWFNFS